MNSLVKGLVCNIYRDLLAWNGTGITVNIAYNMLSDC